jgi:subtilase family serine protease
VADVNGQVSESNETNNSGRVTVTVELPPALLADLKVSGIGFTSTPTVGVPTTAVADLANVGQADREASW